MDGCRYTFTVDYCADTEYFENVRGSKGSWAVIKKNIEQVLADPASERLLPPDGHLVLLGHEPGGV